MDRRRFLRGLLSAAAVSMVPFTWAWRRTARMLMGARARIYVNSRLIGYATSVTYSTKVEPLDVLGRYEPVKVWPEEIRMEVTVTRTIKADLGPDAGKNLKKTLFTED